MRPASPLPRLPPISQLPVKFVWTSGRANKDKAWVFLEAIGHEPKPKQNKNQVSFGEFFSLPRIYRRSSELCLRKRASGIVFCSGQKV